MLQRLLRLADRLAQDVLHSFSVRRIAGRDDKKAFVPVSTAYQPLHRLILSDGVGRTLFDEYAAHQAGEHGNLETGWLLLGLRDPNEATVLATLPAGTDCDASPGHVRFSCAGQALGSRIVRQTDRRLTILGVVHTHPGSLRHPSEADYRGDSGWIAQLRGQEGVFGIGTADADVKNDGQIVRQPKPNVQCLGKLRLSWYALGSGDRGYRALPVTITLGPDLARSLHPLWSVVDRHADALDRLCRQQVGVTFQVSETGKEPVLIVQVPLAESGDYIKLLLAESGEQLFVARGGEVSKASVEEVRMDRAVYLLLAELAAGVG
jgi:hypothetical protein